MIRRPDLVDAFEREWQRRHPVDYPHNLHIAEALYEQACALGIFPLDDPLDGIEVDIDLAKALRALPPDAPAFEPDDEAVSD